MTKTYFNLKEIFKMNGNTRIPVEFIVKESANDYVRALRNRKKSPVVVERIEEEIKELEGFFNSSAFTKLTGLDGHQMVLDMQNGKSIEGYIADLAARESQG
jgi:hypothetical protein